MLVSTAADELRHRLARGPLVLDGALGTELERRGIPTPAPLWSAAALTSAPEVVAAIHRDYVAAGADILVADTFRTNPRTLARAGCLADGPMLNRLAVALARAAADDTRLRRPGRPRPLVAATVAPVEDCYSPERVPSDAELAAEHAQLARWLADAGAELLWIETMGTLREARAAAVAARDVGLPAVVSFVTAEDGCLLGGDDPTAGVAAIEPFEPVAIGLNCIPPAGMTRQLSRLRALTGRPLAAYAHINNATPIRGWSHAGAATPPEYGRLAATWHRCGAAIIGGCCGTTPAHIAEVCMVLDAAAPEARSESSAPEPSL